MPIPVTCPGCSKNFTAPESAAGKRGECPKCGSRVRVPASDMDDGLSSLLDEVTPIDVDDFDDAMRSTTPPPKDSPPKDPPPTRLSDYYSPTPSPDKRTPSKNRRSNRTRGRYARATNYLIGLDWINFLAVVGLAIVAVGYGLTLSTNENATPQEWEAFRLLCVVEFYLIWAYIGTFIVVTALLALLDIEDHLAKR